MVKCDETFGGDEVNREILSEAVWNTSVVMPSAGLKGQNIPQEIHTRILL